MTALAPAANATTRDPTVWPFASSSPWNMPLGSAAQYGNPACDANIDSTVGTPWINAAKFSIPIYSSATTDPVVPIYVDNMQWSSAKTPATAQPSNDSLEPATRSRAGHTAAPRLPA